MIKVLLLILLSSNLNEAECILIDPSIDPLSDEMVNAINSLNTTWKAKKNFVGFSYEYVKGLLGALPDYDPLPGKDVPISGPIQIPESFDAREAWPNCSSISHIRDQGNCGSCWAIAAVDVMSDRICIKSGAKHRVELSAQDLLSCAYDRTGCEKKKSRNAWTYWKEHGIVTGGDYKAKGCRPYEYPPCNHESNLQLANCTGEIKRLPVCKQKCQSSYNKTYKEDKYFGLDFYPVNVKDKNLSIPIQAEIMTNGPVQATFYLNSDFFVYGSGVYQPHASRIRLWHSVRIIGWGVENGVDYWLVANSWGKNWGDKGYVKIRRGLKTCGIEDQVLAGSPKPKW